MLALLLVVPLWATHTISFQHAINGKERYNLQLTAGRCKISIIKRILSQKTQAPMDAISIIDNNQIVNDDFDITQETTYQFLLVPITLQILESIVSTNNISLLREYCKRSELITEDVWSQVEDSCLELSFGDEESVLLCELFLNHPNFPQLDKNKINKVVEEMVADGNEEALTIFLDASAIQHALPIILHEETLHEFANEVKEANFKYVRICNMIQGRKGSHFIAEIYNQKEFEAELWEDLIGTHEPEQMEYILNFVRSLIRNV